MAAEGSSLNSTTNEPTTTFLVKKPPSNSSREIRDAILLVEFGFSSKEIEASVAYKDKLFYVCEGKETDWASTTKVGRWKTNAAGELSIPVRQSVINDILAFHERFLNARIFEAVLFITDPRVRADVANDLMNILKASGNDRIASLFDLLNDTTGSFRNADEVSRAVSYLTDKAGYQDNPFLILVKANAAMTDYKMKSGPGYDTGAITLINEASRRTTSDYLYGSGKNRSAVSRTEAAVISSQLALMYNQVGKETEFRERDWAARFYGISDDERATLKEGDVIEFVSPVTAISTPRPLTSAEQRLRELDRNRERQVKMEAEIDKIASQVVPTDHRPSEYYQKQSDGYDYHSFERRKIRGSNPGYQPKFKVVTREFNPYRSANVMSEGIGAAFELPVKAGKYIVTLRRLDDLTIYLNKRRELLTRIRGQNRYVVPLKPETIEALIKQAQLYGRFTTSQYQKQRVQMTLVQLGKMWEDSYAIWGKRK